MKRTIPALLSLILLIVGYTLGMMMMHAVDDLLEHRTAQAIETMGE